MLRSSLFVITCLAAGVRAGKLWADVCTQASTKSLPFCDKSHPIKERVADYVKRVALEDKALNMQNGAKGIKQLSIPPYQWGSEGLHGPLQPCVCAPGDNTSCACPTSFPCPSSLGAAFNDSLYFQIGHADGREARAINNLRNHITQNKYGDGIDYWSPTINMQRDPRWGRNQEVPGEDPMLTGNYAANFVQGLQGNVGGLDDSHVQITACCKHFIANSLEQWEGHTRYDFDAHVPLDDLRNYYLPAFRACVMEGHAKGVMCSYNAVTATQGQKTPLFSNVPSCANDWLLQQTLRDGWKFDGYVTSDCGAIGNECQAEPRGHGVFNCTEAAAASVKAGTDVNCGGVYSSQIVNAVKTGLLEESAVDKAFARLTTQQMLLGLFDNDKDQQPYFNLGVDHIDSPEHRQLALEAARQTVVLLKNDGGAAPLGAKDSPNIAVIGPHFNATQLLLSNYHGSRCLDPGVAGPGSGHNFDCIVTPLAAIAARNKQAGGGWVNGSLGCSVAGNNGDGIAAAVALAKQADKVVLTMGIDDSLEREGLDRTFTTLPGRQVDLVNAVVKAKGGNNVVLVLFSGGAMSLGPLKDAVPTIVWAGYGGERGAEALADVLFGVYNPTGKLAATMYPPEYVNQIPLTEMGLTVPPGRTHMFYTGTPEFAFGSGLSYTQWAMEWGEEVPEAEDGSRKLVWSLAEANAGAGAHTLTVRVNNTGRTRPGKQTVLLFWKPTARSHPSLRHYLRQKLVAYQGTPVPLGPGEGATLRFQAGPEVFGMHMDGSSEPTVHEGEYELVAWMGHGPTLSAKVHVVA